MCIKFVLMQISLVYYDEKAHRAVAVEKPYVMSIPVYEQKKRTDAIVYIITYY